MPTRSLPLRPSLAQLKHQARDLRQEHRDRQPSAAARIGAHHPAFKGRTVEAILDAAFPLGAAQLTVAREYGFASWADIKHHVELAGAVAAFRPHPGFADALAAVDDGDADRLAVLLSSDPSLVHARTNLDPPFGYFTAATLLHHVAGNPSRGRLEGTRPPLPATSAAIARVLLAAGADVQARTIGPNGGDTMGLLLTSKQASDADVVGPLVDVLLEYGATVDLTSDGCLDGSLANHAPRAAEKLMALGAVPDVLAAASLGRMDLLRGFFTAEGRLLVLPRRHKREMTARDAIGLALLFAYVAQQREAVDFLLEKDGNWNVIGVNNGAALHRAAFGGDLAMVQRLVARGADTSDRNNPFHSTPLGWADHNQQTAVVAWMRAHCTVDLHDAVSFDFLEHVAARLLEDPAAVNRRLDHWDIPESTALHWAAALGRVEAARILLANGADSNVLAGNGATALDVADFSGAAAVAALLEEHGGTRTVKSRPDVFPDWLEPMAATLTEERFTGPEWIFERKFDGIRVLAFKRESEVRLFSRNRLPLNDSYPAVVAAVAQLPVHDVILDGEAAGGFERLGQADYYVFDILRLDGRDLTPLTLDARLAILSGLRLAMPLERVVALDDPQPWERACAEGWEGVIAKRRDSRYEHRRSKHWLKMKCEETHTFVVGGFTDPQGTRVGLGALLVGYFAGDDLCFAGKIGTGFDNELLLELRAQLDRLEVATTPFTNAKGLPRLRAHWVRPEIVVEAGFIEWTGHGKLRHPRLLRVLPGAPPRDVVRRAPSKRGPVA